MARRSASRQRLSIGYRRSRARRLGHPARPGRQHRPPGHGHEQEPDRDLCPRPGCVPRSQRPGDVQGHDKSKSVSVANATSSNYAFAVLNANRSGVYVRAVVPAAARSRSTSTRHRGRRRRSPGSCWADRRGSNRARGATRHIAARRLSHGGGQQANLGAIHQRSVVRRAARWTRTRRRTSRAWHASSASDDRRPDPGRDGRGAVAPPGRISRTWRRDTWSRCSGSTASRC